jgi:LPS-assembly protein
VHRLIRGAICATLAIAWLTAFPSVSAAAERPSPLPDIATDQPVALVADEVIYDNAAGTLTAAGNVEVYYGERTLTADRIVYNTRTDRVSANGKITIRNPDGTIVVADDADLDARMRDGLIRGARSVIRGQAKFASVEARRVDDRYNVLSKAVFSPCEVCAANPVPLWRIRARKIVHDEQEKLIHYEDATFDVMGVSVAWLPYFQHPDPTVDRASGFLAPLFISSSTYGYAFKQPYYWVIDDHSDATFTPFVTTEDGLILEGEYRRAFREGAFEIAGSAGFNDYDDDDAFRGHVFADGEWRLPDDFRAGFSIRQASDNGYLRRFDFTDDDRLTSEMFLRHSDRQGYGDLSAVRFQSLRDDEPFGQIPFVLPSLEVRRVYQEDMLGGQIGFDANVYGLKRTDGRDASRVSLSVDWEREFQHDSGLLFRLFGSGRGDFWQVSDDPAFDNGLISRFSPQGGIEARFPLVRRDPGATHILQPIVQIVAAPNMEDEDESPNEDSVIVEFDETNLFSENRFPGFDGFEEGTRANVGLRYQYVTDEGVSLTASFGRVFRSRAIESFSDGAGLNGTESDFVGGWTLELPPYLTLANRIRIADSFTVNRNEVYAVASLWGFDVEGSYIFLDDDATTGADIDRQEAALAARYALDDNWAIESNVRRDLEADSWVDAGAALTYSNECVDVDLYANKRFTSSEDAPSSFNVGVRVRLWALGGTSTPRPSSGRCAPVMNLQ